MNHLDFFLRTKLAEESEDKDERKSAVTQTEEFKGYRPEHRKDMLKDALDLLREDQIAILWRKKEFRLPREKMVPINIKKMIAIRKEKIQRLMPQQRLEFVSNLMDAMDRGSVSEIVNARSEPEAKAASALQKAMRAPQKAYEIPLATTWTSEVVNAGKSSVGDNVAKMNPHTGAAGASAKSLGNMLKRSAYPQQYGGQQGGVSKNDKILGSAAGLGLVGVGANALAPNVAGPEDAYTRASRAYEAAEGKHKGLKGGYDDLAGEWDDKITKYRDRGTGFFQTDAGHASKLERMGAKKTQLLGGLSGELDKSSKGVGRAFQAAETAGEAFDSARAMRGGYKGVGKGALLGAAGLGAYGLYDRYVNK